MSRCIRKAAGFAISSLAFFGITATSAVADIIQIPAIAFTQRAASVQPGVAQAGTLTTAQGKYYAAVPFPFANDGDFVCSFTLIHRDNDDSFEIIARLFKKRIILGDPSPFTNPILMARVRTGAMAATSGVAAVADTTISANKLTLSTAFYYVELEITGTLVETLGVQIDYSPVC
jgi:hypothetical protein